MICAVLETSYDIWGWADAECAGCPCSIGVFEEACVAEGVFFGRGGPDHIWSILDEDFSG